MIYSLNVKRSDSGHNPIVVINYCMTITNITTKLVTDITDVTTQLAMYFVISTVLLENKLFHSAGNT